MPSWPHRHSEGRPKRTICQAWRSAAPALVSRFRRSYPFAARARANVETKGTPALYASSVALDLTFLRMTRGNDGRNVKSATLVSRFRRSYHFAARARTNVGTKGTLATI